MNKHYGPLKPLHSIWACINVLGWIGMVGQVLSCIVLNIEAPFCCLRWHSGVCRRYTTVKVQKLKKISINEEYQHPITFQPIQSYIHISNKHMGEYPEGSEVVRMGCSTSRWIPSSCSAYSIIMVWPTEQWLSGCAASFHGLYHHHQPCCCLIGTLNSSLMCIKRYVSIIILLIYTFRSFLPNQQPQEPDYQPFSIRNHAHKPSNEAILCVLCDNYGNTTIINGDDDNDDPCPAMTTNMAPNPILIHSALSTAISGLIAIAQWIITAQ